MARKKFLRRVWMRYSKLGRGKKKKQKWRRPRGRDNKMREKQRGYPRTVSIGYGNKKSLRGNIKGLNPIKIQNVTELEQLKENDIVILGKVGMKKKIEIAKRAKDKKIKIINLNIKKVLKNKGNKNESK